MHEVDSLPSVPSSLRPHLAKGAACQQRSLHTRQVELLHMTLEGNIRRDTTDHTSREKPYISFMATAPSQTHRLASAVVLPGFCPKLGLFSQRSTPSPSAVKLNISPTLRDVMKIKQHKFCPWIQ